MKLSRPRLWLQASVLCSAFTASGEAQFREVTASSALRLGLNGLVANHGQWDATVHFHAHLPALEATLRNDAIDFQPTGECDDDVAPAPPLRLRLPSPDLGCLEPRDRLATLHHFFLGAVHVSGVPGYSAIAYRDAAPGIDLIVRADGPAYEYDVVIAPGASLESFTLTFEGVTEVSRLAPERMRIDTPAGSYEHRIGACWEQNVNGGARTSMNVAFRLVESASGTVTFGFDAPRRDPSKWLVIDPTLLFSTYVGGSSQELPRGMAGDGSGASYLYCRSSCCSPITPGAFQGTPSTAQNAWIGKLAPGGTSLVWSTYLGGPDAEDPADIAVDLDLTVVITGKTWSNAFPSTPSAYQPTHSIGPSNSDAFITRLAPNGDALVWSTFLGGAKGEGPTALALAPSGEVVIAINPSNGASIPATAGAFDSTWHNGDQLIARLAADGSNLSFATYFRCSTVHDMAIDSHSNVVLGGDVEVADGPLPTTPGVLKPSSPSPIFADGFVAKLQANGAGLLWSTYCGGDQHNDAVVGVALDAADSVYVCGYTYAPDYPTTPGAYRTVFSPNSDGFAAKLLPNATGLAWSTLLGTACHDVTCGTVAMSELLVDSAGNAIVVGNANEWDLDVTADAFQPAFIGPFPSADAILIKLDMLGQSAAYATWFGGSGGDAAFGLTLDAANRPILGVESYSADLFTTPGAFQSTNGGDLDMVIASFDVPLMPWRIEAGGLAGSTEVPVLAGVGSLQAGTPTKFQVRGAAPASFGWFVVGVSEWWIPLLGGTLVPSPDVYFLKATSPVGGIDFTVPWPGIAPGTALTSQVWVFDPGAIEGWSATNAIVATGQ